MFPHLTYQMGSESFKNLESTCLIDLVHKIKCFHCPPRKRDLKSTLKKRILEILMFRRNQFKGNNILSMNSNYLPTTPLNNINPMNNPVNPNGSLKAIAESAKYTKIW